MDSPRFTLHHLIGERERAEKGANMGNPKRAADHERYKKEVDDFLQLHPELKGEVEKIEDHFYKELYEK